MSGIYIHVPFCTKRCYYCDFYSSVNTKLTQSFVDALLAEIELRKEYLKSETQTNPEVSTIYFGGGTPSLLSPTLINRIVSALHSKYKISENAEITFEANPDDLSREYLKNIKSLGINRLSIGIQSFNDEDLKLMNRRHTSNEALKCIDNAIAAGITNLSIDLIYGLPGISTKAWQKNLETALKLPVTHLSAYHLGIEENTVFANWLKNGKISEANDEDSWDQFRLLNEMAKNAGFEHYEISNLSKPGFESKHNTSYWQGISYLGLGPSAHSFNGKSRQWNISNIAKYIDAINKREPYFESEILTEKNKVNEYIMTALRTAKGIDLEFFTASYGIKNYEQLKNRLLQFAENEHFIIVNNQLKLTLKGWFISDKIIGELMF